jgi:hypothetical protein
MGVRVELVGVGMGELVGMGVRAVREAVRAAAAAVREARPDAATESFRLEKRVTIASRVPGAMPTAPLLRAGTARSIRPPERLATTATI